MQPIDECDQEIAEDKTYSKFEIDHDAFQSLGISDECSESLPVCRHYVHLSKEDGTKKVYYEMDSLSILMLLLSIRRKDITDPRVLWDVIPRHFQKFKGMVPYYFPSPWALKHATTDLNSKSEFTKIKDKIESAAKAGQNAVHFDTISPNMITMLEFMGYKITNFKVETKISW
jgi:hypothetical protein